MKDAIVLASAPAGLLVVLILAFVLLVIWKIWWESCGKERFEEQRAEEERARCRIEWIAYCKELDDWFKANARCFERSGLNRKQLKILYALAEHTECSDRLEFWQILMLWGCDSETGIERLRFDADFEKLDWRRTEEALVYESGGCESLDELNRTWFLTTAGRDFLLQHKII